MSQRTIEIDRLELRVSGISADTVRVAASGLGQELLQRLASLPEGRMKSGSHRIGELDSGKLSLSSQTSAAALRSAIAQKITGSIQTRLSPRGKQGLQKR